MSPSPRKILILGITRMGDLVQSIPFVRRLHQRHPDARIDLLVESAFADVARLIPHINQILPVRLEELLPCLDSSRRGDPIQALKTYRDLLRELRAQGFDEVWNLTHTRPATVLNFLLAGAQGKGVTLDESGVQVVNSPWLRYFFATNLARPWCQFNLADIYANCVHEVPWEFGRSTTLLTTNEELPLEEPAIPWKRKPRWIALHPGASQPAKQWPVESFAALAARLTVLPNIGILVVGSRADLQLGSVIQQSAPVVNLIGSTTPIQLAHVLKRCELLVSNDSGPMHVAAAVGTRVLDITVGSALGSETAPYGMDHVVIEPEAACFPCSPHQACSIPYCGDRIRVETVTALVEWMLGVRTDALDGPELAGARAYCTRISPRDGLLELKRLFSSEECERDVLNNIMRPGWLAILSHRPIGDRPKAPGIPRELRIAAAHALEIVGRCRGCIQTVEDLSAQLPLKMDDLQTCAANLRALDAELESVMDRHGLLRSFLAYAWLGKASLAESGLGDQARESLNIYQELATLLSIIATSQLLPSDASQRESTSKGVLHDYHTQWTRACATS